jgi:hypothetical protein
MHMAMLLLLMAVRMAMFMVVVLVCMAMSMALFMGGLMLVVVQAAMVKVLALVFMPMAMVHYCVFMAIAMFMVVMLMCVAVLLLLLHLLPHCCTPLLLRCQLLWCCWFKPSLVNLNVHCVLGAACEYDIGVTCVWCGCDVAVSHVGVSYAGATHTAGASSAVSWGHDPHDPHKAAPVRHTLLKPCIAWQKGKGTDKLSAFNKHCHNPRIKRAPVYSSHTSVCWKRTRYSGCLGPSSLNACRHSTAQRSMAVSLHVDSTFAGLHCVLTQNSRDF